MEEFLSRSLIYSKKVQFLLEQMERIGGVSGGRAKFPQWEPLCIPSSKRAAILISV